MEDLETGILDISKIKVVPSDTEIPVHDNHITTNRPLCSNFPENATILDLTEAIVQVVSEISQDLEESEQETINNVPQYLEELQAVFDPLSVTECRPDIFGDGNIVPIDQVDELKKYLSELLIRFDTNPKNYTKDDYSYLLGVLYKSLLHLYLESTASVITTRWMNPHRDDLVPSEKLVKETLDYQVDRLEGLISTEESERKAEDLLLSGKVTTIEGKIPEEASSSNLLADKDFVNLRISTETATFRGTYNSVAELDNVEADNNDYAFVISTDSAGNTLYNRYKYNGEEWLFEYAINNTNFTTSQWSAINSGITSLKVATYDGYQLQIEDLLPLIYAGL